MKHRKIYSKNTPLLPVDYPAIGGRYHVAWGKNHGVVGVCIGIDQQNKTVTLRSPKTRRTWNCQVKFSDLRHTRRKQFKIEQESK